MAPLIFHFSLVWPWHFSLSLSPHVLDVGVLAGLRSHTLKTVEAFSALAPVKWHGLKEHLSPATAWALCEVLNQDQFLLLTTKNLDVYTISKKKKKYLPTKNVFYG